MSPISRAAVSAVLMALVVSAFFIRVNNFNKAGYSIDEIVYYQLARGLAQSPARYNTIAYADFLKRTEPQRTDLPKYFTAPLFKHPPVFAALGSISIRLFKDDPESVAYVSAFFGALIILLGYFLGRLFWGEAVGVLTAVALFFDPVNIICSQKAWMDTTLAFFMVLSLLLFAFADKTGKSRYFILSGVAAGLAVLTKYPGALATGTVVLYVLLFRNELFRDKNFLGGVVLLPVLMLLPWGAWNVKVYGWSGLLGHGSAHGLSFASHGPHALLLFFVVAVVVQTACRVLFRAKDETDAVPENLAEDGGRLIVVRRCLVGIMGMALLWRLLPSLRRSLSFYSFPFVSWQQGLFRDPIFYFGQLIEFSFLYVFGFLSFFFLNKKNVQAASLLIIGALVIFLFFLLWGGYQTRYILAVTPLLIVLALGVLSEGFEWARSKGQRGRILGAVCLALFSAFLFLKINYVNFLVSYPNDMCYF